MKLHELKIKHKYLVDIALGNKMFELRKNDRDYQVDDLIRFIDIRIFDEYKDYADCCDVNIDEDTLYKITCVLKDVPQYGLKKGYCILGIKKLNIVE